MQRILATNGGAMLIAKPLLANAHAPALIADVHKDVAAAVEGAEGHDLVGEVAAADADLEDLLDDEDGLLEGLARDARGGVGGDDADGAVLAHQRGGEVHGLDAVAQGGLGDVQQGLDGGVGPGRHLGGEPAVDGHGGQQVRRRRAELEQVVGLAAHDDDVLALLWRQVRRARHRVQQPVQPLVVPVRGRVAGRRHDADPHVLAQQVQHPRDDGVVGLQAPPVVVERDVPVERRQPQVPVRRHGHQLRRVEDQPHVVERRRHEPPRRDVPLAVLELEGRLQRQPREEVADAWHQEPQLRRHLVARRLVRDCDRRR